MKSPKMLIAIALISFIFSASAEAQRVDQLKQTSKKRLDNEKPKDLIDKFAKTSIFFPDWSPQSFDYYLRPEIGLKYTDVTTSSARTRTLATEIGLLGGLESIPLVPGNPGLSLSPYAGYVFGREDGAINNYGDDKKQSFENTYRRSWAGLKTTALYKAFRYELDLSYGKKDYQADSIFDSADYVLFERKMINDFGLLIIRNLSTHYTIDYSILSIDGTTQILYTDIDHWVHARWFANFMAFYLDAGPGFKVTHFGNYYEDKYSTQTNYIKARTGLRPFWKLVAKTNVRYIISVKNEGLSEQTTSQFKSPSQSLYAISQAPSPDDSVSATAFIGLENLFAGFGVGWQYELEILNLSEQNDTERKTTKDHGFAIVYTASL